MQEKTVSSPMSKPAPRRIPSDGADERPEPLRDFLRDSLLSSASAADGMESPHHMPQIAPESPSDSCGHKEVKDEPAAQDALAFSGYGGTPPSYGEVRDIYGRVGLFTGETAPMECGDV